MPLPSGSKRVPRRTHLGQVRPTLRPAPEEPPRPHFRHTFGSHLAQHGVSLYKISTLMGNSPEICRRHYASLCPEKIVAEVDFGTHTDGRLLRTQG